MTSEPSGANNIPEDQMLEERIGRNSQIGPLIVPISGIAPRNGRHPIHEVAHGVPFGPIGLEDDALRARVIKGVHDARGEVGEVQRGLHGLFAAFPQWNPIIEAVSRPGEIVADKEVIGAVTLGGPEDGGLGELLEDGLFALPLGPEEVGASNGPNGVWMFSGVDVRNVDETLDAHFFGDARETRRTLHVDVLEAVVARRPLFPHEIDGHVGVLQAVTDRLFVLDRVGSEEDLPEVAAHLEPHHLVVFAVVGQDHLRAVLAQPIADGAPDAARRAEDGGHATAEAASVAVAPLDGSQVQPLLVRGCYRGRLQIGRRGRQGSQRRHLLR